jgi:hypothetical protein
MFLTGESMNLQFLAQFDDFFHDGSSQVCNDAIGYGENDVTDLNPADNEVEYCLDVPECSTRTDCSGEIYGTEFERTQVGVTNTGSVTINGFCEVE